MAPADPYLRLALPNKGRIAEPVRQLAEKSGLHIIDGGARQLIAKTVDPQIEILFARPVDIPEYVANGAADLGITGHDMVAERGSDVEEVLDLHLGKARLVLAVPEESEVNSPSDLDGAKVATEFPSITAAYFNSHNVSVTVVPVSGACEATPHLGIADAIIDLSSSGVTLMTHRLRVFDVVMETSTVLIANRRALEEKGEKIAEVVLALESVVQAKGQCYLMMNVNRSALDDVIGVLPGLSGPTVMNVASHEDMVAVHAVVGEGQVYRLINRLKRAGARDILVMPIDRIIR